MMIAQVARRLVGEARLILRHRLAKGAGFLTIGQYSAAALNFVTTAVMARLLGSTDYGLVALTIAYPTLVGSFVAVKSGFVTARYIASFRAKGEYEQLKAVVKLGYVIDFLVALVAFILIGGSCWWVSCHFYQQPALAWLMLVYAASFLLVAPAGISWAVLSSWEHFRCLAAFEVLHPLLKLILITGFLFSGFGVAGAVIGIALAQAIIGFVMMVVASSLLLREGIGHWWKASWGLVAQVKREITGFLGWNYLLMSSAGLVGQIPLILLGHFRGPEEVGFYRLVTSIASVSSHLESSLGRVIYPTLSSRWATGEKYALRKALTRWSLKVGIPLGVLLLFMIPFLPVAVSIVFGPGYEPVSVSAQIMMPAAAASLVFFWLNSFYYAIGKIALWVKAYCLYTILFILLAWLLVWQRGFYGLVIITALAKVGFTLIMFWLSSVDTLWLEENKHA